ncbi:MAG: hypothetical protein ACO2PK_09010 [Armatimonadota bacterium]
MAKRCQGNSRQQQRTRLANFWSLTLLRREVQGMGRRWLTASAFMLTASLLMAA